MRVTASINTPPAYEPDFDKRNNGPDKGLVNAWLHGIKMGAFNPELARRAKAGELPTLPFKGGLEKKVKTKTKVGAHLYIAMWQGLRGEDLNVDPSTEIQMLCAKHGVTVTFTSDVNKLFPLTEEDEL